MTWIHSISSWVPAWIVGAVTIIVPAIIVLALSRWIIHRLMRLAGRYSPFLQRLLSRSQGPVSLILVTIVSGIALAGARFPWEVTAAIGRVLAVAFVVAIGWAAAIALDIGVEIYLRRFHTDTEDNLLARKHVTQMRILQRVAKTILVIFTAAAALMSFDSVRQYGVSLFASAGAAGLVLGLAARPVLSNLLAGIQIAMTQPIRVEDQVVIEGETGWIETITSTYVVVRLWDLRRMIVPLSCFIEKPFQNWTYEGAAQIGSVRLYVDDAGMVDRLRHELDRTVRQTPLWDGKVASLQVTDVSDSKLELRVLVSARSPGQTWDLRCDVREKLASFLQREYAEARPPQETGTAADVAVSPVDRPASADLVRSGEGNG